MGTATATARRLLLKSAAAMLATTLGCTRRTRSRSTLAHPRPLPPSTSRCPPTHTLSSSPRPTTTDRAPSRFIAKSMYRSFRRRLLPRARQQARQQQDHPQPESVTVKTTRTLT
ncbi:hypothetical protein BCR44DRAFT_1445474 [Catenaria anguillulae PL171]|uniref:Uncharacterized protein n=1 Tax=Catenaria anguillulae PL171 TaxID=765915 RepID=A0A1Y2H6W5_9FUNG|nr:hypothetical protein BCR44DRAFT_1445474 [Catenaria anguillulae PL171]